MISLNTAEAFAAYEAARHRLPRAVAGKPPPRRIGNLADISDDFDVFLLDAFGVLNIGDTAIPDTPERVRVLQEAGKRVLVVSNAASVPRRDLLQKYADLGYAFDIEDIITSRMAALAALARAPSTHWGVMGVASAATGDFDGLQWDHLAEDAAAFDRAEGFLLVGSGEWSAAQQALIETSLASQPRKIWVANPDIVAPRETAFSTEPGYFAHRLAAIAGVEPVFFGKPFGNIFDLAFDRVGAADRSRIVMVGDSLHTDILGAQTAGIASVLISGYGFFARGDADAAIAQSGIVPDFIAERP